MSEITDKRQTSPVSEALEVCIFCFKLFSCVIWQLTSRANVSVRRLEY